MTEYPTPAVELAAWMNDHDIRPRTMGFYMAQTRLAADSEAIAEWEAAIDAGVIEDQEAIPTTDGRMVAYFPGDGETGPGWYADDSGERAGIDDMIAEAAEVQNRALPPSAWEGLFSGPGPRS